MMNISPFPRRQTKPDGLVQNVCMGMMSLAKEEGCHRSGRLHQYNRLLRGRAGTQEISSLLDSGCGCRVS